MATRSSLAHLRGHKCIDNDKHHQVTRWLLLNRFYQGYMKVWNIKCRAEQWANPDFMLYLETTNLFPPVANPLIVPWEQTRIAAIEGELDDLQHLFDAISNQVPYNPMNPQIPMAPVGVGNPVEDATAAEELFLGAPMWDDVFNPVMPEAVLWNLPRADAVLPVNPPAQMYLVQPVRMLEIQSFVNFYREMWKKTNSRLIDIRDRQAERNLGRTEAIETGNPQAIFKHRGERSPLSQVMSVDDF